MSYTNVAAFITNDTEATGSDSTTVEVCRTPPQTGARTMGFWQNKNGQSVIKAGSSSTTGVCNSATWLRQYAPFQNLSAMATCGRVATYVFDTIKVATCTSTSKTCNSMLKAQMLATALDVYFTSHTSPTSLQFLPSTPIGPVLIDLDNICANPGSCAGSYLDVGAAFGGASSMTVSQMLAYAASRSNMGGSIWYGQVKATQVLAKDGFDAINNEVAFTP